MKEHVNYFCFGFLICLIFVAILNGCEDKKNIKPQKKDSIEIIKQRIDTVKVEVIKLKDAKTKFIYRTKFDTLATIDTVLIELKKCDTIVKIDSVIIQKQDTIIKEEEIIGDLDLENQYLTKEVKKAKRKLIFTKILAGIAIVLTIIATR